MITIRNGSIYRSVDEGYFLFKKSKGRLKGWEKVEVGQQVAPPQNPVEIKPHISDFATYKDIQKWLDEHGLEYDHNCRDKKKLYNVILNS